MVSPTTYPTGLRYLLLGATESDRFPGRAGHGRRGDGIGHPNSSTRRAVVYCVCTMGDVGAHAGGLLIMVSRTACGWSSAAVVACRFGEARRRAMPDSSHSGARLHTCLPRSGCWETGPELGLWACPSPAPGKYATPAEREGGRERRDPRGPPPRAPAQRLAFQVGMLRCVCVCGREPLHPPTLSHPVLQFGSLAVWQP